MKHLLRAIPSVNDLLDLPESRALAERTSRSYARDRLRATLDGLRAEIVSGRLDLAPEDLVREALDRACATEPSGNASLRLVVNATGVVLHTNLGRAPLSARAARAVAECASTYSNLEYNLAAGRRGQRDAHGEALLCDLLGCEAAVVANNNAAAVMLVLNTLAAGGEVVVSRGELVEIGGGFRIPEVLERSGCTLREVGTTNRTRAADYERAITERTRLLLRVHPSNYRIEGFTERPSLAELAELGRRHQIPVVEDLGSGCLVDGGEIGLDDEPRCQVSLEAGIDIITFSGDKLLGGPQAGIVAGRADLLTRIRRNPLMRALRVDKMVYAALEATLMAYVEHRAVEEIPALRMLAMPEAEVRGRAERLAAQIQEVPGFGATVVAGASVPGAGAAPGQELPTALVALTHDELSAVDLERALRAGTPPVIGRIEGDRLVLDLRTVIPGQEPHMMAAIRRMGPADGDGPHD